MQHNSLTMSKYGEGGREGGKGADEVEGASQLRRASPPPLRPSPSMDNLPARASRRSSPAFEMIGRRRKNKTPSPSLSLSSR